MRRNKHRIKQLSLYLAVLTLFLFASCGTEPEREDQVVSERAVELFNLGIASYQEENFSGESRAYAVLKKTGEEAGSYGSYLQMTRGLYRNDQEEPAFRLSVRGFINSPMPGEVDWEKNTPLYECYLRDGISVYDYEGEENDYKVAFAGDYLSHIGLYAISEQMPNRFYAISDGKSARIDLTFNADRVYRLEGAFIQMMNLALFGGGVDLTYSDLTVSALLDEEEGRFTEYTVTFAGTMKQDPSLRVEYTYFERFFDYGTEDEIAFPDFEKFPLKEVK